MRYAFLLMLWPDILPFGRVTSDVVICMRLTQSVRVGHIATVFFMFQQMGEVSVRLFGLRVRKVSNFETKRVHVRSLYS